MADRIESPLPALRNDTVCSDTCPYAPLCPFISSSRDSPCLMKDLPIPVQKTFYNLFLDGIEGLRREALSAVFNIRLRTPVDTSAEASENYLNILLKTYKSLYSSKDRPDIPKNLVVTIKRDGVEGYQTKYLLKEE